jgi:hypothetical protein
MTVRSIVRSGRARRAAALLGLATTLAACDGLKEAMTAHVDVAATAAGRELSVERLATLMTDAGAPRRRRRTIRSTTRPRWTPHSRA